MQSSKRDWFSSPELWYLAPNYNINANSPIYKTHYFDQM